MGKFKFGHRSRSNLITCHIDLQVLAVESLAVSQVDFTIIEGARNKHRQQMLFDTGKSKVNPKRYSDRELITKGKHIVNGYRDKSWAFDFIAAVPDEPKLAFDIYHLMYLIGVFTSVGNMLYDEGRITHKIRSGSNWDMDGQLKYDQNFFDAPHIELI